MSTRAGTEGQGDIYVQAADGSGPAERVGGTRGLDIPRQWLADSMILFTAQGVAGSQSDIYTVVVGHPGSERALLESPFNEQTARVDPSGRWLYYLSEQDGTNALYVRRYPSLANPVRVASGDSRGWDRVQRRAVWSADGRSVFYVSAQDSLIRVTLDLSGEQARVVSRSAVLGLGRDHVEITDRHPTDGKLLQWVLVGAEAEPAPPKLILILNFDQEIRRIMGEGR